MPAQSPHRRAAQLFVEQFGREPVVVVSAPGRVNLLGEHTDYNGGPVLPVAIERRTAVAVGAGSGWRAVSAAEAEAEFSPHEMAGRWTDYLAAAAAEVAGGGAAAGARIAVASTVPVGAGLSSSAALTVAAVKALALLAGRRLGAAELAELAYRAEHDRVGVRCGRMDQTIAARARPRTALLLETATGAVEYVPLPGRVWVVETGVAHRLTGGALNERRRECESALEYLRRHRPALPHLAALAPEDLADAERLLPAPLIPRVRHVVTETARTRRAATLLARGDLAGVGGLMLEGHHSLRDDYRSSCAEADLIVETAAAHGAWGARLTGAGWGGAVLVLAPDGGAERMLAEVGHAFEDRWGRVPAIWSSRAAGGVRTAS